MLRRWNLADPEGRLYPTALRVDFAVTGMAADTVLAALAELEALPPTPGVGQTVIRTLGDGQEGSLDLSLTQVDPAAVRNQLEKILQKR